MLTLQVNTKHKSVLGAIQLPSFLGKSVEEIKEISFFAERNAVKFMKGGFDGVFIQDTTPGNLSLDVIANLASVTRYVKDKVGDFCIGTQMECDNANAILAIAKSTPSDMVRIKNFVGALVKNNGLHNGQGPEALKYKIQNKVDAKILCDIFNLTGVPIGDLSLYQSCSMALKLGVSGLIICGHDYKETISMLSDAKRFFPSACIICGGNVNEKNVKNILQICDGIIVSSCLKKGNEWDYDTIEQFIKAART